MLVHVAGWGATNERGRNPADALQKLQVCNSIIQKKFHYLKERKAATFMQGGGIPYLCILFIYRFPYSRPKNAKMSIQLVVVLLTLANKCVPEVRMEKIVVLVTLVLH